jgi:hypothetical protein
MPEKKEPSRNRPSPNLGHPCFVYEDGAKDPSYAMITFEYADGAHDGYIDAMIFPRDRPPYPRQSIAPADYVTAFQMAEIER